MAPSRPKSWPHALWEGFVEGLGFCLLVLVYPLFIAWVIGRALWLGTAGMKAENEAARRHVAEIHAREAEAVRALRPPPPDDY
jgi:uncharacterized RDD family membrane protein YckC